MPLSACLLMMNAFYPNFPETTNRRNSPSHQDKVQEQKESSPGPLLHGQVQLSCNTHWGLQSQCTLSLPPSKHGSSAPNAPRPFPHPNMILALLPASCFPLSAVQQEQTACQSLPLLWSCHAGLSRHCAGKCMTVTGGHSIHFWACRLVRLITIVTFINPYGERKAGWITIP
jgi:hypothetical protein